MLALAVAGLGLVVGLAAWDAHTAEAGARPRSGLPGALSPESQECLDCHEETSQSLGQQWGGSQQ